MSARGGAPCGSEWVGQATGDWVVGRGSWWEVLGTDFGQGAMGKSGGVV